MWAQELFVDYCVSESAFTPLGVHFACLGVDFTRLTVYFERPECGSVYYTPRSAFHAPRINFAESAVKLGAHLQFSIMSDAIMKLVVVVDKKTSVRRRCTSPFYLSIKRCTPPIGSHYHIGTWYSSMVWLSLLGVHDAINAGASGWFARLNLFAMSENQPWGGFLVTFATQDPP